MADVINLRLVRKAKARVEKEAQATQNRVVFVESKPAKIVRKAEAQRVAKAHLAGIIVLPIKPAS